MANCFLRSGIIHATPVGQNPVNVNCSFEQYCRGSHFANRLEFLSKHVKAKESQKTNKNALCCETSNLKQSLVVSQVCTSAC